ncbi:MAG: GNAT family N-acetyltransferase [bacterium]
MNGTLQLRRATRDDARLLADLAARTLRDAYSSSHSPGEVDAHIAANFGPDRLATELESPKSATFLAFEGEVPCGYATIRIGDLPACVVGPEPVELLRIYLTADAMGRGHGSALLRSCLEEARRWRRETMWLGVWEENARAIIFYERWGFRRVGTHEFVFGGKAYDDLVMARSITTPHDRPIAPAHHRREGEEPRGSESARVS